MAQSSFANKAGVQRMAGKFGELASAAVLVDSAAEMVVDALSILKDCDDLAGHNELHDLSELLSRAAERIRQRKAAFDASPANENDPGTAQ